MKKVIFSTMVFCLAPFLTTNFAQAKFGVQLPFLDRELQHYDIINNIIIDEIKAAIKILFLRMFEDKILIDKR